MNCKCTHAATMLAFMLSCRPDPPPPPPAVPDVPAAQPDVVQPQHTEAVKTLLRQAEELEAEARESQNRLPSLRRALALNAAALRMDDSSAAARNTIERLSRAPEVVARRAELEREIFGSTIVGLAPEVAALLREMRDLDPLAPDLKLLPEGAGMVVRAAETANPEGGVQQ